MNNHQPSLTTRVLFYLVALFCVSLQAQTPGKGTYRDGFPKFLRIDPALTQNVVLTDTVVSLAPFPIAINDPDTFVLSGVDWRYPSNAPALFSPEDIDKIPEELEPAPGPAQDFYLITAGIPGGKVYYISTNNPTFADEFGGAANLVRPVDAYPYRSSNGRFKVVITDQGGNRVMQVDWSFIKTIDWQYGGAPNLLSSPADAVILSDGREVLIADAGNNRVIVVDTTLKAIVWNSSTFGNLTFGTPVDVEASGGQFLITDQNNHRVIIVQRSNGQILWQFGNGKAGSSDSTLNRPSDADFLSNGNILICDTGNKRLIEIDRNTRRKVYQFSHPLADLRDADRLFENIPDHDKTLVIASNLPISQNILPFRLAYASEVYESNQQNLDFSTPVDFDSLSFPRTAADVPNGTRIRLRLRSANVIADLNNARWHGPKDTLDFYAGATTAINPVHDGQRFLQYQVFLDNNSNPQNQSNPLLTPLLRKAKITAHFFDTNTSGVITSMAIRDSAQLIITSWKRLAVNSVLPADPQQRTQVQITMNIRDESNQNTLFSQPLSSASGLNQFDLALVDLLRRRQAVRLQAVLKTNNSGVTPKLNDWQIEWENTRATASSLKFTDPSGRPVNFYRVAPIEDNPPLSVGTVFLALDDMNLNPIEDAVNLQVRAVRSGDLQTVQLAEQPSGLFILNPGYPAVMTSAAPSRPDVLEGRSKRDTLTVRYVDPTDPADISTAAVLLIQNVKGNMLIEKRGGARVDSASVNDSLFVHLTGETDRDLSPALDSLVVEFINTLIFDREKLTLYELANNTGEFRSRAGIPLVKSAGGLVNDGKLQVSGGEQVRVEFIDLDSSVLSDMVQVRFIRDTTDTTPTRINHTPVSFATSGQNQTISAILTDSSDGIQAAAVLYRRGGDSVYGSNLMFRVSGDNNYQGTIPFGFITERGAEYYILVADGYGNLATFPTTNAENKPQVIQVVSNNLVFSSLFSPSPIKAYRMISVPFDLNNKSPLSVLGDDLGSVYDDKQWRLLRYVNGVNVEFGSPGFANFDFKPGLGF